ncbi:uroporphyrinogen-III C-methyltransferase [Candidatus Gracilibacteria bacterium]|nr:uroporphyrinogen-III C-methyltransferase [Candidatus Gracilibacteria bacterium]
MWFYTTPGSAPICGATCRADAELLDVGKRAGGRSLAQWAINELLVAHARAGRSVVRLKGGDPFVFGRGGEEAAALVAANIPWEVVPGISSAIAVPAYAGIPLTHRSHAASFAVVTGHEDPTRDRSRIDWHALATGIDTLVFLMSTGRLSTICAQLIAHGRPADTPTAVIRWGTTEAQTTVVATLATTAVAVAQIGLTPPALLVVGEVVALQTQLRWFEANAPLVVEPLSQRTTEQIETR